MRKILVGLWLWLVLVLVLVSLCVAERGDRQADDPLLHHVLRTISNKHLRQRQQEEQGVDDGDDELDQDIDIETNGSVTGEYHHPRNHFYVTWKYQDDLVDFFIASPVRSWLGVGFAPHAMMYEADIVVGMVQEEVQIEEQPEEQPEEEKPEEEKPEEEKEPEQHKQTLTAATYYSVLSDRHVSTTHVMPVLDIQQDVEKLDGFIHQGWSVLRFKRKVNTGDPHDMPLDEASFLLWAVGKEGEFIGEHGYGAFTHHFRRGAVKVHFPSGKVSLFDCFFAI